MSSSLPDHPLLRALSPEGRERARRLSRRRLERMLAVLDQRMLSVRPVLEAVRRRHNASAILRTADALGLHRVHLVTGPFRPSPGPARGAERWLELRLHPDTPSCFDELRAEGFRLFVADLVPSALPPERVPVDRPLALLLGAELAGVSDEARRLADGAVALPMRGFVESFNVSVAAALLLRPLAERRRALVGADLPFEQRLRSLESWLEREAHHREAAARRNAAGSPGDS